MLLAGTTGFLLCVSPIAALTWAYANVQALVHFRSLLARLVVILLVKLSQNKGGRVPGPLRLDVVLRYAAE